MVSSGEDVNGLKFVFGEFREEEGKGGKGRGKEHYQFRATIGFPRIFNFLDFGLCLILCSEERFFFFWSSRPMFLGFFFSAELSTRFLKTGIWMSSMDP